MKTGALRLPPPGRGRSDGTPPLDLLTPARGTHAPGTLFSTARGGFRPSRGRSARSRGTCHRSRGRLARSCRRPACRRSAVRRAVGAELPVPPAQPHELLVVAALHDAAVLHDADAVGVAHRGQPVRDDEGRAPGHERVHAALHDLLGARVDRRGRLVQDEGRRVGDGRPRDGEQLALALGEPRPVARYDRPVPVRKAADEPVGAGLRAAVDDVGHDEGEEDLHHHLPHGPRDRERGLPAIPPQRGEQLSHEHLRNFRWFKSEVSIAVQMWGRRFVFSIIDRYML